MTSGAPDVDIDLNCNDLSPSISFRTPEQSTPLVLTQFSSDTPKSRESGASSGHGAINTETDDETLRQIQFSSDEESSDDEPFLLPSSPDSDSSQSRDSSVSDYSMSSHDFIKDTEVLDLNSVNSFHLLSQNSSVHENVAEDIWARAFFEGDEFLSDTQNYEGEVSNQERNNMNCIRLPAQPSVSSGVPEFDRERWHPSGLEGWNYKSPFSALTLEVDNVDALLCGLFYIEARCIVDRLKSEIKTECEKYQKENNCVIGTAGVLSSFTFTRMDCFNCFLPISLLEIVRANVNRVLTSRSRRPTTVHELRGIIVLHVLASVYGESARTICDPNNKDFFLQLGIPARRYKEIWSTFSCTSRPRGGAEHFDHTWNLKSRRGNDLVMDLEERLSSVDRHLVYVPGSSVLSLDDHHLRLSSRAVESVNELRSVHNPKKALGPVCNALCSALNPFIIACHYSRQKESLVDIWIRLVQLLQVNPTKGLLNQMADVIFAGDRGYNCSESVKFVTEVLGAGAELSKLAVDVVPDFHIL